MKRHILIIQTCIMIWVLSVNRNGETLMAAEIPDDVDKIVQQAVEASSEDALRLISRGFELCRESLSDNNCQYKLFFATGYIYQTSPYNNPVEKQQNITRSLEAYRQALQVNPDDVKTLKNLYLIYSDLDNKSGALEVIDQLLISDPANTEKYYIHKADLLMGEGDIERAIPEYKKAYLLDVHNEQICWQIFDAYDKIEDKELAYSGLIEYSNELLKNGYPDQARSGFLQAMNIALANNQEEKAQQACLHWAECLTKKTIITHNYASELPSPKSWPSKCNTELQRILTHPEFDPNQLYWWDDNAYRRHLISALLLSIEKQALLKGDSEQAVEIMENLMSFVPPIRYYDRDDRLQDLFPVKIEAALELSKLYGNYPEFDPEERKFRNLIQEMFNEKSLHYLGNNLEAIQRSHTMLGLIYADRGIWESGWYAGNGIFQLEHAIEFQNQIVDEHPEKFKPLPGLYEALASGYNVIGEPEKEFRALTNAAQAYLDLDNLNKAATLIQAAHEVKTSDEADQRRLTELTEIGKMRSAIREDFGSQGRIDINAAEAELSATVLFDQSSFESEISFINRQRFKVLTDIGQGLAKSNPDYNYPYFEIEALKYIENERAVSNQQDIKRIQHIESSLTGDQKKDGLLLLNYEQEEPGLNDNSTTLQYNTNNQVMQFSIDQDVFIRAKLYQNIQSNNSESDASIYKLVKVQNGEVTILNQTRENYDLDIDAIRQLDGVSNVRLVE